MNTEMTTIIPAVKPVPIFTIKQAVQGGYALAKRYFIEMVALSFVVAALSAGVALTTDPLTNGVAMLVNVLAIYAYAVLALRAARGQSLSWLDFIDLSPRAFGSLVIASFLATLALVLGLVFLIVPGLMAAAAFCFYALVLVDHKLDPVAALRASWNLAKPVLWTIVGLYAAFFALAFLPILFSLGCGLIVQLMLPYTMFGWVVGGILGVPSLLWLAALLIAAAIGSPFVHAWMYEKLSGK